MLLFLALPKSVSAQVSINEFVIDSDTEWVEFYNSSDSAEYLKSYYIDDDDNFTSDSGSSGKKSLSNLNITNISFPYLDLSSAIFNNSPPDNVVLFDGLGNVIDSFSYNVNPGKDVSMGRFPDKVGDFSTLASLTKGSNNSQKAATPTPSQSPTNSPTANPSKTPSPVPTSTLKPTSSPTPKTLTTPKSTPEETGLPDIFNLSEVKVAEPTPTGLVLGTTSKNKKPFVAIIFIFSGVIFLGYGAYLLYNRKNINDGNEAGS